MYAGIFEVAPRPERRDEYLELAHFLKPELEKIDGFVAVERFASKRRPGRMLSLSIWRDEDAVVRWRSHAGHRRVQHKGRSEIFADYRLRLGETVDDAAGAAGAGDGAFVTISEWTPANGAQAGGGLAVPEIGRGGVSDVDLFDSIYVPGKQLLLVSWSDPAAAAAWRPQAPARGELRHRVVRVARDYGLFDRREAPQQFPDVKRAAAE